METTHESLLIRLRDDGDVAAWRTFDSVYRPLLYRYALAQGVEHNDAEDVVQQSMAAVHQHIASFDYDPSRGRFKSWLRTLVHNKVCDLRARRRELHAASGDIRERVAQQDSPEEAFERIWMQEHLWHCLRELRGEVNDSTYQAFIGYVVEQRPIEDVARETGLERGHVYTIKWRLTEKIAQKMKTMVGDED